MSNLKFTCFSLLFFLFTTGWGEVLVAEIGIPIVVNTWAFTNATQKAWEVLQNEKNSALDAIEQGCTVCEVEQCDFTVGYGGSPDENGETTLDAMIMDGTTMNVGAVASLRGVKNAVGVARKVLAHTKHSMLAGELATKFAVSMGFKMENLSTPHSTQEYDKWRKNSCQPNFWLNVTPDPTKYCGPYKPLKKTKENELLDIEISEKQHDTIGMVAIDDNHRVASGTSTNGAIRKIPGRVGDAPIAGAGSYADDNVGGAAATGDGDLMMRFLPSFFAVEEMRRGASPEEASESAIKRISEKYPKFMGAVIAVRKDGVYGAACHGIEKFPYSVANPRLGSVRVMYKKCK